VILLVHEEVPIEVLAVDCNRLQRAPSHDEAGAVKCEHLALRVELADVLFSLSARHDPALTREHQARAVDHRRRPISDEVVAQELPHRTSGARMARQESRQLVHVSGRREEIRVRQHHELTGALANPAIDRHRESRLVAHLQESHAGIAGKRADRGSHVLLRIVVQDHDLDILVLAVEQPRQRLRQQRRVTVGRDEDAHTGRPATVGFAVNLDSLDYAHVANGKRERAMRLVTIVESPAPYTTPILNALARSVDLHLVYLAAEDRVSRFEDSFGVPPDFEHSVHWAKRFDVPSVDLQVEFSAGVARRLSRFKPDAVLLSSWKPAALEPLLWSRWSGSAAVMWAESTPFSGLLRGVVSTQLRRVMARTYDAYVSNGSQATRYLLELGVPTNRIVTSVLPAGMTPATSKRATSSTGGIRFLFVGRLVARKRPLELIAAFRGVREALPSATLTIVGGGELESEVRTASTQADGVHYVGHREGEMLAQLYEQSDVLVLPALREVWGVVVNEALAHGLFVVATDQVGSAYDLLVDGNGVMLPADDVQGLGPALVEIGRTLDVTDEARGRRANTMERCTPVRFATDIQRAAELAVHARGTRRGRRRH
jgi:glycosyltransferase involved in cell wall biosynthesis